MDYFSINVVCLQIEHQTMENMIKRKDGFNGERALVLPASIVKELEADVVASILYITDIGYYPKAWHHFRERTEPIDQYVFIYCMEGEGWYRLRDHEYKITSNQYFILPAGEPHAYGLPVRPLLRLKSNPVFILVSVIGSICLKRFFIPWRWDTVVKIYCMLVRSFIIT